VKFYNIKYLNFKKITNFSEGRDIELLKNISYSFLIKFIVALIGLVLVPMNLNYLNQSDYGVFLMIASINSWMSIFDLGIGNGLRTIITNSIAKNEFTNVKIYLSTAYAIFVFIVLFLIGSVLIVNHFINWNHFFNTKLDKTLIDSLVILMFSMLCIKLLLSVVNSVLISFHKVRISNFIELITFLIILIATYLALKYSSTSLLILGVINFVTPVLIALISNFMLYHGILKNIKPEFGFIDFSKAKQLLGKGLQFFVIQLSMLMVLFFNQILIARFFSPKEVTVYSVISKYFSIPLLGFTIVIMPFWSSFNDALVKNDLKWIKNSMAKLKLILYATGFIILVMVILFPYILDFWIDQEIVYSFQMLLYFAIFVFLTIWASMYNQFINAMDKVKVQLYSSIFTLIFPLPISYCLCKLFNMGPEGILLSAIICQFPGTLISNIQYKLLIDHKAKGIWYK